MNAIRRSELISPDAYLVSELASTIKREYLGGVVYAVAGASNVHNQIASNALIAFGSRLRGTPCRAFNSDTKIRIRLPQHQRFYYPDMSVVCRTNPPGDSYQDEPTVILEVLSESTRRVDEGEKREAYQAIPSLSVLLLVEPESRSIVVYRRTNSGFVREVVETDLLSLPEIGLEVPLAEIYDGVEFAARD